MSSILRSLMVKVGADVSGFNESMKNISKDLKAMSKDITNAGKEISDAGKTLTMGLTLPIAGAGAAAFKFAADAQDAMGAADQTFKSSAGEVKDWAGTLKTYYGISKGEALTYANTMGAMLKNIGGLSEAEAAKQSQTLIKLAGDLTAMFGGTTQSAIQALTGALKGNNSMLDNYGMGVNDATIKTKALEMGLMKEGEQLTLASKQAATLALIMEQTADAQGQAEREASGASGSMRSLTTELKNAATALGGALLPVITPFITKTKEVVEGLGKMSPETQKNIITMAGLAAAIGPALTVTGKLTTGIGSAIGAFGKAAKALSTGAGLVGALGALIGPAGLALAAIAALAAVIGTVVAITGRAGREIKQMTQDLIESYEKEAEAKKVVIDEMHAARIESLNKQLTDEESASNERIKLIESEHEKEMKSASKKEQTLKKNLQERKTALDKSHNEEIQRIRDEYGVFEEKIMSKTDLVQQAAEDQKKALDDEVEAAEKAASEQEETYRKLYENTIKEAEKAHKEKTKMLDDEYVKSIRLVDEDLAKKIQAFQDEINGINQKTEEENRLLEEQRNNEKIAELQKKVEEAQDDEERRVAQKALSDEINRINREKELENRKIQIDSLKDQIEQARTDAEDQKTVLKETLADKKTKLDEDLENLKTRAKDELDAHIENEGNKLKALKERVETEKTEIDLKAKKEIELIQQERIEKETAENKKYEAAKTTLDKEEVALDGFAERYKEKLEDQLKEKKRIEDEKLKAVKQRIADELAAEQEKMDEEKRRIDEETKAKVAAAATVAKETVSKEYISPLLPDKETLRTYRPLPGMPTIGEMFPGFAEGVKDFRGGLARINEVGGEIVNLPNGTNVIPHDVSMQIAKSIKDNRYLVKDAIAGLSSDMSMNLSPAIAAGGGMTAGAGGYGVANIFVELDGNRFISVIGQRLTDNARLKGGIKI